MALTLVVQMPMTIGELQTLAEVLRQTVIQTKDEKTKSEYETVKNRILAMDAKIQSVTSVTIH